MIRLKLQRLGRKQSEVLPLGGNTIRDYETYSDYIQRLHDFANTTAKSGEQWTAEEVASLYTLLEAKAGELEIAAAFPRRVWGQIRRKISQCYSDDFYIHRSRFIQSKETIAMYRARIGDTLARETVILDDGEELQSISSDVRSSVSN
jgi:hypothetical protein